MLIEKRATRCCDPDHPAAVHMLPHDQPAIGRFLPHGERRARSAPSTHHFGVAPLAASHPLEKIEDQGIDRADHGCLQSLVISKYNISLSRTTAVSSPWSGVSSQLIPFDCEIRRAVGVSPPERKVM